MKTLVVGDFGIIHQGHLDHIMKAYAMSDWLIIATHRDESIKERKGYDPIPLWARMALLRGFLNLLGGQGEVVLAKDTDGGCVKTLDYYMPDIFAKGGDRKPDSMPQKEIDICKKLGIEIIYGVGDLLNSSRRIAQPPIEYQSGESI